MDYNIDRRNDLENKIIDFNSKEFIDIMSIYQCAMNILFSKINEIKTVINEKKGYEVVKCVTHRMKSTHSIIEKLVQKHLAPTYGNLIKNIRDVSGIRIVCNFEEDIFIIKNILSKIDGINIVDEKDYINNPKPSGYRAYHLIVEIPLDDTLNVTVEIQIRTVLMDYWSEIEHQVKYKKNIKLSLSDSYKLTMCANAINFFSGQMEKIYRKNKRLLGH